MKTVRISKEKLLVKLNENRSTHREIFEEALSGWQQQVILRLESAVKDARDGKIYQTYFDLPIPQDHTPDYNEVIERVEWHEAKFIELELREFNQFVRDCWDWMPDFLSTSSSYSSSSSSSLTSKMEQFDMI